MFKAIPLYLALLVPVSAENLFENSKMNTSGGWKGSKRIIVEDKVGQDKENRVLRVTAKKRDQVTFSQEVESRDVTDFVVKLRYQSKDYDGRGLEVRGVRQSGSHTFFTFKITADGEWHDISLNYSQVQGSNKIDFKFIVLEGEGDVHFDDITVEAMKRWPLVAKGTW